MSCYLKDTCKKFKNNICVEGDFCLKLFKTEKLFDLALLSKNQRVQIPLYTEQCDVEAYELLNSISKNIRDEVDKGLNLYIYSENTGNGKTSWALRLIQNYINSVWYDSSITTRALYINVPRYLLAIKDAIGNVNEYADHIKNNVLNADLVIWDDIATKTITEFESENLLSIINTRLDLGKSNIYTANIDPSDIQQSVGARLTSRIIGKSKVIHFKGKDKRNIL